MDLKLSNPYFSIIFPIYNREAYLKEALSSISSQSFQDFELIAIDDGSTDSSIEILKQHCTSLQFSLIVQDHLGVSQARNAGIQKARGKYICFVDSDDVLPPDYLLDFYSVIQQTQAKVLKNTSMIKFNCKIPSIQKRTKITHIQEFNPQTSNIKLGGTIWSFCIERDFLSSISLSFLPNRIMEDEAFIYMLLPLCKKLILFRGSPYLYRQHSQSIVSTSPIAFDRLENFKNIIEWYRAKNLLDHFPIPFYILYDVSINNPQYKEYLQRSQALLRSLDLENFLSQDKLANALAQLQINDFIREHQKSRGKFKYYLRRLLGWL